MPVFSESFSVLDRGAWAVLMVAGLCAATADAQSIRCVTLTGRQAPGTQAGAVFESFSQPVISGGVGVVVRGALAAGAGGVTASNDTGIWRFPVDADGQLVVREGGSAPGLTGVTLAELGLPVPDAAVNAIGYWARLQGAGINTSNDRAIFLWQPPFQYPWYQAGSPIFGTPDGTVLSLDDYQSHPTMNAGGYATFRGAISSGQAGVFAIDITTDSVTLGLQGQPVPDLPPGVLFGTDFSAPVRDNIGDVAFRFTLEHGPGGVDATNDTALMIRMATDGTYYHVARTGDTISHSESEVFDSLSDPIVTDEPRVGFRATLRQGIAGVDATNDKVLCSMCPCGSVQVHVQSGSQAGNLPAGILFDTFSLPLYSRDSRLLFGARLRGANVTPGNDSSVWWMNLPFEQVMAAREGQAAPGGNGATFVDFDLESPQFWLGTSEHAQLVFTGQLSTGQRGLWVFTPYRGTRALVIEGQSVEVAPGDTRQIVSLALDTEGYAVQGRRCLTSSDRRAVFEATVTGGQTGIFLADLPPVTLGCPSDWDNSGDVNSQDFFMFLTDFFAGVADVNNSGTTDSQDIFDFLVAFFSGC